MEATALYYGMGSLYRGNAGIMDKNMETTTLQQGSVGYFQDLNPSLLWSLLAVALPDHTAAPSVLLQRKCCDESGFLEF